MPWLGRLADEMHEPGTAVMIQLTQVGHRTSNGAGGRVPVASAANVR